MKKEEVFGGLEAFTVGFLFLFLPLVYNWVYYVNPALGPPDTYLRVLSFCGSNCASLPKLPTVPQVEASSLGTLKPI